MLKRRVLIIDDDRDFAESLCDILELNNYACSIVQDFFQVCPTIESFKPQVVLIDIRLGQDDGLKLLPFIKKTDNKVMSIMMTAYAHVDTAVNALQSGAYDYVRKPVSGNELLIILDRCYEKIKLEHEKKQAEDELSVRNEELEKANNVLLAILESTKKITSCTRLPELRYFMGAKILTKKSQHVIFFM